MSAIEGWETVQLKEVAALNYGKDLSAIVDVAGTIPIHGTSESVRWGRGYLYDGASVILGRKGSIDRVKYVEGKFWTIDTAYYLSDFEEALPKWLYYFLSTINLRSLNEATGVPSLSRDRLYMIEVPRPPLPEQAKIAEVLSTVDRAIEQTEALIEKQQRIKTGLMGDLLTRGIDEHGNLRSEATHAFKDSPLGRIPVEWQVVSLSMIVDENITYGIVQAGPHLDGGIPYIRTGDMSGDRIVLDGLLRTSKLIAKSYARSTVYLGDIVFALRATVGKVLPVTPEINGANLTQGTAKISPSKSTDSDFLLWALRSEAVQEAISLEMKGTTFMEITLTNLREVKIAVPSSTEEQQRIAEIIDIQHAGECKFVDQKNKLRSLKTALMQDLLTGQTRVTPLLDQEVSG